MKSRAIHKGTAWGIPLLALALALGFAPSLDAQLVTTLGIQASGNAFPFNFSTGSGRYQTAYAAADLGMTAGSSILEIRVFGSAVTPPTYTNMQIRFAYSTLAVNALTGSFDTNYTGTLTTALQGNVTPTITPGTGGNWYHFPLTTPFVYNGSGTLLMDWSFDARSAAGWTISSSSAVTPPEQVRSRAYLNGGGASSPTGTAGSTAGNWGVQFVYTPQANAVFIGSNGPATTSLFQAATDAILWDISAGVVTTNRTITSMTFNKTGTVPDAGLGSIKLVHDTNADGMVDLTDIVLGTSAFSGGAVTFTGAPLVAVNTSAPTRMLLTATYTGPLTLNDTFACSLQAAASVTWSGGTDLTAYPLNSPNRTVTPYFITLGNGSTTSGNTIPFNTGVGNFRYQTCYTPAELGLLPAGAMITEIQIHGTAITPSPTFDNFRLRLAHTTTDPNVMSSTFDANYTGTLATVFGPAQFTPTALTGTLSPTRWSVPLSTPFFYNGTDGILVDWTATLRTGTGFNIGSNAGRQRVYNTTDSTALTGTLTTSGNYGFDLLFNPNPDGAFLTNNSPPAQGLAPPMVDTTVMRLGVFTFTTLRHLNSITFRQTGTIADAAISNVKLVRDNNDDGLVDAGDTTLGSGVLTAGAITFSGTPLQTLVLATPSHLLLAVSVPTTQPVATTMQFEITSSTDVVWTAGPDLGGYPIRSGVYVQRMAGNYTINQTAGDFPDVGAAFDALEANGVSGPVTLTITDSATYQSNPSYTLGFDNTQPVPLMTPVLGSSSANRITLRAAPGQNPVIQGNATGAILFGQSPTSALTGRGGLVINNNYVTVEGLTVTGGPHFGIIVQGNNSYGLNYFGVEIKRCKVFNIPEGPGIAHMGQNSGYANEIVIENNFVWNCLTSTIATSPFLLTLTNGSITVRNAATGTGSVRHNTILHTSTLTTTGGIYAYSSSTTFPLNDINNNIVVCTAPGVPAIFLSSTTSTPTVSDFNFWFSSTHCNQATLATFALWQAAGKDTNGSNADPLLVSTTGTIDLHLTLTSPCIDPTGQTSTVGVDVDGDFRPNGAGVDIGADEAIIGPPPAMDVKYNAAVVAPASNLNAGNVPLMGSLMVFTVENAGPGDLRLFATPAVQLTPGANCDVGTVVQTQPALTIIPALGFTTFEVYVQPAALGAFDLSIAVPNNDPTKNPYTFTVSGMGVPNNGQAIADLAAGSSFAGNPNGPFTLALNPGDNLANASLELTDPEADNITVVSITQPTPAATGIVMPTIPAPGHPLTLTWTGTADGANPPGNYTWVVEMMDAVNGTPVLFDVTITINDAAPVHVGVAGQAGSGTLADPYTTDYTEGITGTVSTNLSDVSDPNTMQVVTIDSQARTGGNAGIGTGFQFALAGGVLSVAPAGALIAADIGTQEYTITVTDGTNLTDIIVLLTINEIPSFVTTVLTDATQNSAYNQMIATIGGSGTRTVTLTGGTLPVGILLAGNGTLSGMSTDAPGTFNFILTVTDDLGASSNLAFTLDLVAPAGGIPVITSPAQLPNAPVNGAYTVQLQATGGVGPYTWAITGGTLPTGLTMTAGGEISGTATVLGTVTFTATVTDSVGVMNTASLSIDVVTPPSDNGGGGGGGGGCVAAAGSGLYGLFALAGLGLAALRRRRK